MGSRSHVFRAQRAHVSRVFPGQRQARNNNSKSGDRRHRRHPVALGAGGIVNRFECNCSARQNRWIVSKVPRRRILQSNAVRMHPGAAACNLAAGERDDDCAATAALAGTRAKSF